MNNKFTWMSFSSAGDFRRWLSGRTETIPAVSASPYDDAMAFVSTTITDGNGERREATPEEIEWLKEHSPLGSFLEGMVEFNRQFEEIKQQILLNQAKEILECRKEE